MKHAAWILALLVTLSPSFVEKPAPPSKPNPWRVSWTSCFDCGVDECDGFIAVATRVEKWQLTGLVIQGTRTKVFDFTKERK